MEVKKIIWSRCLDSVLLSVLGDDLEQIKKEVESGISELWEISNRGYTITRIEQDENGNPYELVFVAGVGRDAKAVINYFKELAKPKGIKKMRIHSKRGGMGRYLKSLDFYQSEIIYKAEIV